MHMYVHNKYYVETAKGIASGYSLLRIVLSHSHFINFLSVTQTNNRQTISTRLTNDVA